MKWKRSPLRIYDGRARETVPDARPLRFAGLFSIGRPKTFARFRNEYIYYVYIYTYTHIRNMYNMYRWVRLDGLTLFTGQWTEGRKTTRGAVAREGTAPRAPCSSPHVSYRRRAPTGDGRRLRPVKVSSIKVKTSRDVYSLCVSAGSARASCGRRVLRAHAAAAVRPRRSAREKRLRPRAETVYPEHLSVARCANRVTTIDGGELGYSAIPWTGAPESGPR